jgi:hypothetical protein
MKLAELQICSERNAEADITLSELLVWILKRTGLKWVQIKQVAKGVVDAGDYEDRLSNLLDAISRKPRV